MDFSYRVLYSSDSKSKRDKVWHDGILEMASGYGVLKEESGSVLVRELTKTDKVTENSILQMGRYTIQVLDQQDDVAEAKRSVRFRTQYTSNDQNNQTNEQGTVEYDGKSLVVFKDQNGKQLARKVCPGVGSGEIVCAGRFYFTIMEPIVECASRDASSRKTMVSRSAVLAAAPQNVSSGGMVNCSSEPMAPGRTISCIYTEDKHKKQNKRWIDGVIRINGNMAAIENEETKETIFKRQFANPEILIDGYEFDGGKYRFQVAESTVIKVPEKSKAGLSRKRILTVSEIKARKDHLLQAQSREGEDASKKPKTDSLFDMFDDL